MAAKPSSTPVKSIELLDIKPVRILLTLVGETPLIVHAWSAKAKKEMLDKQMGAPKAKKAPKDPLGDFEDSLYRFADDGYGFPSVAFKAAAVTAITSIDGMTKVAARQAFRVVGEQVEVPAVYQPSGQSDGERLMCTQDLVRVRGSDPRMREDMVRIAMGTADIRYRGEFWPWWVTIQVDYSRNVLSESQIINLFNLAGFAVGIGEWRSERDGQNGAFRVAGDEEAGDLAGLENVRLRLKAQAQQGEAA